MSNYEISSLKGTQFSKQEQALIPLRLPKEFKLRKEMEF